MWWSKITVLDGAATLETSHAAPVFVGVSYEGAGLVYPVKDTVLYIRPTLKKSWLLYGVSAAQPLILLVMLVLIITMSSVSIDRGSGLISILAGIERATLDVVDGASLSDKLEKDVKMLIRPSVDEVGTKKSIEYVFATDRELKKRNGRLRSRAVYR